MNDQHEGVSPKILIVEDEVLVAVDLKQYFEGLGYEVCPSVTSAETALNFLENNQPDLVIMDIVLMGPMDGLEAAEIIRHKWGIPIVFLTAYADTYRLEKAKLTYPFGYLLKPFTERELKVTVEMALYVGKVDAERRKTETALARSNELLRMAQEAANCGAWNWNVISGEIEWSAELFKLFGLNPTVHAASFDTWRMLLHPEDKSVAEERIMNAIRDKKPLLSDYRIIPPDGKERWIRATGHTRYDSHDNPYWMAGICQDITERQQAEEALRKNELKFRNLFNNSQVGMFITRLDGSQMLDMNDRFLEIFGRTREEMIGTRSDSYWADPNQRQEMVHIIKTEGRVIDFECGMLNKQGEARTCLTSLRLDRDQGILEGSIADITDRKRYEQALAENELRLRTLIDSMPDIVCFKDGEGRWLEANKFALELFQIENVDYRGKKDSELALYSPFYRQAFLTCQDTDEAAWKVGVVSRGDEVIPRPDDSFRVFDVIKVPSFNHDGSRRGLIVVGRDITDRKQAEKEKAILQNQLHQAQKMEAIGILAGGIAHDFNNILQAISGYTSLILIDKKHEHQDYPGLKAIEKSVDRAADLVKKLLLFSRKAETTRRPVKLDIEVDNTRRILERTIPRMIDIEVRTVNRLWSVNADPVQIEQILFNLGTNAADAMPDGGKLIIETLNVTLDEAYTNAHLGAVPGRYVLLSVSDTGHGMDRETVQRIFEPFFTTKEIGRGTGLGLASVYGIVKYHGGYITCNSEIGHGTTFKIYFPAIEPAEFEQAQDFVATKPKGGTETILLVDDEEFIRNFAKQALLKFGYQVLTAATGEEALAIYTARPHSIDLVIMDLGMPGIGGHKCLREIRQLNPSAKIIMATGYSNELVSKTRDSGAVGFLGKPYRLHDLLEIVRMVLDGKD